MSVPIVYLAGPITGCGYGECTDWRKVVAEKLILYSIECLNPMRGKKHLEGQAQVVNNLEGHPLSCQRGIMTRDHWDATRCDVLLVNLLGANRASIGTVMEIAWAYENRIPIIVVMEPEGNPHDHCMIREAIGFRVDTLDAAIDLVKSLLNLE